jgi:hypothetical protein
VFEDSKKGKHVTTWTASWVNVNDWAHFHGHYLFLHEDKYYMRNKNNKITQKTTIKTGAC